MPALSDVILRDTIANAPTPAPLSITTTVAGDLIFAAVSGNHGGVVYTAGSGFSLNNFVNGSDAQATEWALQSSPGSISATFGATSNDDYAMALIAFQPQPSFSVPGSEGDLYFDVSTVPFTGYLYHSSSWHQFA